VGGDGCSISSSTAGGGHPYGTAVLDIGYRRTDRSRRRARGRCLPGDANDPGGGKIVVPGGVEPHAHAEPMYSGLTGGGWRLHPPKV
jgi:hypothetical protein